MPTGTKEIPRHWVEVDDDEARFPENERLTAGLAVLRTSTRTPSCGQIVSPTGTRFMPIGMDGDTLKVIAETPAGVDTVERIASWPAVRLLGPETFPPEA